MSLESALRPTLMAMWRQPCPLKDIEEGRKPDFSHILSFYDPNALEINVKDKKIYKGHQEITGLFKEWMSYRPDWPRKVSNESFTGGEDLIRYTFELSLCDGDEVKMIVAKVQYWKKTGDKYLLEVGYQRIKTSNV